jgi:glycosyltransferase involved in cell wall biosynthesis
MKFTILTPTILRPTLRETCASLDSQSYQNWQHLVVVDLPAGELTPEQRELVESFAHPNRSVSYCERRHRNYGNTCRSRLFELIGGDYVLHIDDDDVYLGEALQTLAGLIEDSAWGLFPIERFGEVFFNLPPSQGRVCSNQFFYRPFIGGEAYRYTDNDSYDADWMLVERLLRHPYQVIECEPLARVTVQHFGS